MLSGLYDLTRLTEIDVNEWLHLDEVATVRNSPLWPLPSARIRIVGGYRASETNEFKLQIEVYFAACHVNGYEVTLMPVPGATHFDIPSSLADASSRLRKAMHYAIGVHNSAT